MSDCIEWRGAKTDGYGVKRIGRKTYLAHRLAYCKANDLLIEDILGAIVMHTCDNPPCVNPEHLVLGTKATNNRDMAEKGRHGKSVLTAELVKYCRGVIVPRHKEYSYSALATRFGIKTSSMRKAIIGETWGHVA